jgi:hypothetical protein
LRSPASVGAIVLGVTYAVAACVQVVFHEGIAIGVATVLTLVVSLVASVLYTNAWRPRWPEQQLVERVRDGQNPLSVAYTTMLLSVCPAALLFSWLGFDGDGNFGPAVVLVFTLCCTLGALFGPRHIAVDGKGVYLQRAYGWLHVPWRAFRSITVSPDSRSVTVQTRRHGALPLAIAPGSGVDASLLCERVLSLRPPSDDFDPTHARFAALDRHERPHDTWLAEVRALTAQRSFRDVAITLDDLRQLLVHDDTPHDRRVAAAEALVANDPATVTHVRVAIDACDDRTTRHALEDVAERATHAARP